MAQRFLNKIRVANHFSGQMPKYIAVFLTIGLLIGSVACENEQEGSSKEKERESLTFCDCMAKDREMRQRIKEEKDPAKREAIQSEYKEILEQCKKMAENMTELEIDEARENCDVK